MEISGEIRMEFPPEFMIKALLDPAALEAMIPVKGTFTSKGPGQVDFTVSRSIGLVNLTLAGSMQAQPKGKGLDHQLIIRAGHVIGGKVHIALNLMFHPAGASSGAMSYTGAVEASGMAGRVLRQNAERVDQVVLASLTRLKTVALNHYKEKSTQV